MRPPPMYIIDSGNGYQAFWGLTEPIPNDGDYDRLERMNKHLEALLGGDSCHNIDRIMRIPGTINLPTKKKIERGYQSVVATLVSETESTVEEGDFELLPERFLSLLRKDKKVKARWAGSPEGLNDDSRSAFDMSMVALLKRRGLTREDTERVLRLFPFGQPSETRNKGAFAKCWDKAGEGGGGFPIAGDALVEELNREFAVVLVGGKLAVLSERTDASGEPSIELLGLDAFKGWLRNRLVLIPSGDDFKLIPLSEYWLGHPNRRQFRDLVFSPDREVPEAYNYWRGFVVAAQQGDWGLLRSHLLDNVCRGDEALFAYFFGWWAALFQHPGRKLGTAMVLRGKQGVGKSIVGELFGLLIGRAHYRPVSDQRFVTGRFNSHMFGCLLLHADEAFWAGDKAAEGALKSLVTAPRIPVELKGKETFWIDNHVRVFITTNSHWAVPAGMEERRFVTLDVGEERIQDRAYFRALVKQFNKGGAEALMYDLLNLDLSSVDLREIPKTEALRDQKEESMPIEQQWLLDLLMRGQLPGDKTGDGTTAAALLYDHFIATANKVGTRRRPWEMTLSKMLFEWIPEIDKDDGTYWDPRPAYGAPEGQERRGRVWHFPKLDECRAAFDEMSGESWPWEEQSGWIANDDDEF